MSKQTPVIYQSALSGRWYVATKWHERRSGFVADEKYDITDQIAALTKGEETSQ